MKKKSTTYFVSWMSNKNGGSNLGNNYITINRSKITQTIIESWEKAIAEKFSYEKVVILSINKIN